MDNDDEDKYRRYANIPIPTYDEALLSRPSSSSNFHGPQEISDDAERQGLLGQSQTAARGYRPPTVESARTSLDSDLGLPEVNGNGEEARRHIEELDYMEADTSRRSPRPYSRTRLRSKFSRRWNDISATLSSIRLPSFRSLYRPVATDNLGDTVAPSRFAWLSQRWQAFSIPEQYRMSAPTFARLFGLFAIIFVVYALFVLDLFPRGRRMNGMSRFDPGSVREYVMENADGKAIQNWLYHITSYDHVAGTEGDLFLAKWMEERWREEGNLDEIMLMPYYVFLNYPGERSVEIVNPEKSKWTAALEEEKVYSDRQQTLAWHGHSRSGEVAGHLVYANGGSRADFHHLRDKGIATNGSIALIKHYGDQKDPALKIKAAEEAGCVGVLIYSDPSDVDETSPWKPTPDSLQRGGVSLMNWVLGDPLTPGYASTKDANRVSKDNNPGLPNIPSLPLSWRDAQHLLNSLQGHGVKVENEWVHGDKQFTKDWYSGNASTSTDKDVPVVHLKNLNDENHLQQIWNLHGQIEGMETPDRKIIIGNHRDSWCFGAVDPGSGSAVLIDVIRIFGELRNLGWRPLRTIEFVSWDAKEYNLVGSTEYVEDHLEYLRSNAYAYLNVGVGVSGPDFRATGSPMLKRALNEVLGRVSDPGSNQTVSILQKWKDESVRLGELGADGDYVAFQDMAGTSSIDFGFERPGQKQSYPHHSCYENFEWATQFGDPGDDFPYHKTLVQIWTLLILELADRPLLPFDLREYANALKEYISTLEKTVTSMYKNGAEPNFASVAASTGFTTKPLHDAAELMAQNADVFHRFEDIWTSSVLGSGGFETATFTYQRLDFNDRLAKFETDLLDADGVPGRTQFKHVIFGPQPWDVYATALFPAVFDAVLKENWEDAQKMLNKAATRITEASTNLVK